MARSARQGPDEKRAARREALLALMGGRDCAYAYDLATVSAQAAVLRSMRSMYRILNALKANPHPEILRTVHAAGCGIECVSRAEIDRRQSFHPA